MFFATLPEDEKEAIVNHLDGMIEKTIEIGRERSRKEISSAVDELMGSVQLWDDAIRENCDEFNFLLAARNSVFEQMLSSNPEKWSKYDIAKLLKAWTVRHPEELRSALDAVLLEKLEQTEKELAFQRRINER